MKKAQYRKYKEIYRVDLDILKEVIKIVIHKSMN